MNNELISVIMSTYNEPEKWIRESVESILNQSYINIEFIIVCDNPQNKILIKLLEEYKRKDSRITIILNEKNIGLTKSLNKAIIYSNGEYIARMDSDDIADKERLEKQIIYLNKNKLDLIGAGVKCITENKELIAVLNKLPKENNTFKRKIRYNNCMPHPTWFGRKDVFSELNGYRNIDYAEDYDFILRALHKGFRLGNINEVLLDYRMRSTSISNKNGLKQFVTSKELVKAYRENYILDYDKLTTEIKNKIIKLNEKDEEKYLKAGEEFSAGIKCFNIIRILRALITSKYYRKKTMCYLRGLV